MTKMEVYVNLKEIFGMGVDFSRTLYVDQLLPWDLEFKTKNIDI